VLLEGVFAIDPARRFPEIITGSAPGNFLDEADAGCSGS
jgi:hypothetical protein